MKCKNLVIILGDQLSLDISSLLNFNKKTDKVFMMEVWNEATHIRHHKKKLVLTFSSMRHFFKEMQEKNYKGNYIELDSNKKNNSLTETLEIFLKQHAIERIVLTEPSEYRVLQEVKLWNTKFNKPVEVREDNRFFMSSKQNYDYARDKKNFLMENYYRFVRKKYQVEGVSVVAESDATVHLRTGIWAIV
jgi:deoxyribodipyrimidine photolyase-related protein